MRLRQDIAMKNVRGSELRPQVCKNSGCSGEIVTTGWESGAIDGPRRGAANDRKGIPVGADPFQFANTLENPGLISAAGAAAGHNQPDRVSYRLLVRRCL